MVVGGLSVVSWTPSASAQTPDGWAWSSKLATSQIEFASSIAVDSLNNAVYTAGQAENGFSGILGGPWSVLFGSNTGSDGYLVKQTLDGAVLWRIVLGGDGSDGITGVCTDMQGRVYVTGYCSGTNASFTGPTGSIQTMSSAGGEDIFVACYNANGALQWKIKAGGAGNDRGNGICYANGQVFVGGSLRGPNLIAGMSTPASMPGNTNIDHAFLVALQATDGAGQWIEAGFNGENSAFNAVATDGTQVFALGVHKGTAYTYGSSTGPATLPLVTTGNNLSADVLAVSTTGQLNWTQSVANPGSDNINALGLAASSTAVYISGSSHNNSIFPGTMVVAGTGNPHDYGYLAKLNKTSGQTVWVRTFTGSSNHAQVGRALATDSHGDVLLAGTYKQYLTLPNSTSLSGEDDVQVFVSKFNGSGTLKWAITPSGDENDLPNGVALDGSGGVYVAGSYQNEITFNTFFSDDDSENLFVAKLHDLDFDVAEFRDPSRFIAPGPFCRTDGPLNLTSLLIPERSGSGIAVFSSSGIGSNGSNGPGGALGQMPGGVAVFDNSGDQIVIDLGNTIPVGEKLIIRWRSTGGAAIMNVQGSFAGAGGFTDHGMITTGSTVMVLSAVVATAPMRFVKLTRAGSTTCEVDGVFYNFGSATDGTWSGDGVTGTTFDPSGLSGNANITYTANGRSTTQTVVVATVPVGGALTGGNVCPGSAFTATLTGQSAGAVYWSTSLDNGGTWQVQGPLGATFTISSVTQTTLLKAQVNDPPCPAGISNVVTITALDNTPPTITCPANVLATTNSGCTATGVNLGTPTASDNCTGVTVTNNAPSAFPKGSTTVIWTATDASGNTETCTQTVTVTDNIPPTITCPASVLAYTNSGCTATGVNLGTPTASDNCTGVTVTNNAPSAFPKGTNTVTWTATDASGNTATCTQTVTVTDNIPPDISCSANITVNAAGGTCGQAVTYTAPVGTDNCSGVATARTAGIASGATFPVGVNTVTYTATDAAGNTASCSFTITVVDNIPPAISCPANITVNAAAGSCDKVVTYNAPVGTDNCSGVATSRTAGLASGSTFPIGVNTVTHTATDAAGNTTSCSFTITVVDHIPPAISCPANITVNTAAGTCGRTVTYTAPVGTDNCSGVTTARTAGLASGATFPVGMNTVTYTATDAAGNTASCSFTITVIDNNPPAISCPANITVNAAAGTCAQVVTYTPPVGTDNCSGVTTARTAGLASGATFPVGVNTVTYTATDAAGNTASCSFTITVVDNIPPAISCPANITVNAAAGTCGQAVTYTAPVGTDNCSGVTTARTAGLASGATFPVGVNTVTYTATDAAGNTASCSFIITVVDNIPPAISCPANITVNAAAGTCGQAVTYTAPVGTDNCSGVTTARTAGLASGATFPVGMNTVTYTATDAAGNTASCSFTITVGDNIPPAISCPANITVNAAAGTCGQAVTYTAPVGTDNCSGVTTVRTAGLASGATFPVGMNTVTYTATDAAGNTASCSFTITVVDNIPPTISCPANITVNAAAGTCGQAVTYTAPVGTDNCSGVTTARTAGLASGATFPVGMNTVTYTATDAAGNTASCSFTITVIDNNPPAISCPANITVNAAAGTCAQVVTYTPPLGTDNCSGVTTARTAGLASGATFPVGVNTVTYTATDAAGNTASCSFIITVVDNIPPTISCPANITVNAAAGTCGQAVTYTAPVGTDNCSGVTTARTAGLASGATFPVGVNTVTYTATDVAGNTASCSFTVTVNDLQAPEFSAPADTVLATAPGLCSAILNYTLPSAIDACDGTLPVMAVNNAQAPGSTFPIGTTTVLLRATDSAGNITEHSFTVTVQDEEAPLIVCPSDISVPSGSSLCGAHVSYAMPTAMDNCATGVAVTNSDPAQASDSLFPLGVTIVQLEASDNSGNTGTCSFSITVLDVSPPTFTAPSADTLYMDANGQASMPDLYGQLVGVTDCSGMGPYDQTPDAGSVVTGDTTATLHLTDGVGNDTVISVQIVLLDTISPTISCPDTVHGTVTPGQCGAVLDIPPPQYADNSGIATLDSTGTVFSGELFPAGTYTVNYVVTDPSGLTASCPATVIVLSPVLELTYAMDTICSSSSPISPLGTTNGGVFSASPVGSNVGATTGSITPLTSTPGSYTIYMVFAGPCPDTASTTITIEAQPGAGTSASTTICSSGAPVNLFTLLGNGADAGGTWSSGNGTYDPASDSSGTFIYTVSAGVTCAGAQASITVTEALAMNAGADSSITLCGNGPSVDLTTLLNGADAGGTWSNGNGQYDPVTDDPGTVMYIVVGSGQCPSDTTFITVLEQTPPNAGTDASTTVCTIGNPVDLFALLGNGADAGGTWSAGIGTYDPVTDSPGTFTYTVPGGTTCADAQASITVTEALAMNAGADSSITLCGNGPSVDLTTLLNGADAGGTWSNGNGQYDPVTDDPGTVMYIVVGSGQCPSDTTFITVLEQTPPNAGTDASTTVCTIGNPVDLFALLGNGADAGGTWSAGIGTYDPVTDSPGTFTYTVPGGTTCTDAQASITVTETLAMNAGADSSITLCGNDALVDLSTLLNGADAEGDWSNGSGQYDPASDDPAAIMYIVAGSGPCPADTAFITVLEQAPPNAGISANLALCSNGSPVNLITALGGIPDQGGQWSQSNGTLTDGSFDPTSDPADSFTYTVEAVSPCSALSSTVIVTVAEAPSAAWTSPSPLCNAAQPMDMAYTVTGESGGTWSGPGIAADGQHFDPSSLTPQGSSEDLTVTYTVTTGGCTNAQNGAITVLANPTANAGTDGDECGLEHVLAADLNIGSGQWSAGTGVTFNDPQSPSAVTQVSGPGTYALQWTVTNGPCSSVDTVIITYHLPEELTAVDAGPDHEQNISRSAMLNGFAEGATELHWSVMSGSGSITAPDLASTGIHGLSIGTNLILLSARVGSCPFQTDTTAITVHDLFIPSGFSPNGDGVNDSFEVIGIDVYPGNEFTVFNRYGQQVLHVTGYANEWDGKDGNGKELADGTYFYVLSLTAEETYHGQVIIKR